MAICEDTLAALSAQIESIRAGQLIPDPGNEVDEHILHTTSVKWVDGRLEKTEDSYKYVSLAPSNDAMGPDFPSGFNIIFSEEHGDLKDGDIVVASLCVRNGDEFVDFAEVIRRYSRMADGRVKLTPLREGFSSWTEGDLTPYGLLEIIILGIAVPYEWKQVSPHGDGVIFTLKTEEAYHA